MINWGAPIALEYDEHAKIVKKQRMAKLDQKQLHGRDEIQSQDVTQNVTVLYPKLRIQGSIQQLYNAQWVNGSKAGDLCICSCGQRHSTHLLRISERIKGKIFAYNW